MKALDENGSRLTVGRTARLAGVGIPTMRFYERAGLLPRPMRTESNYRLYPDEAVTRIRFIRQAQKLGFTLKEMLETDNEREARKAAQRFDFPGVRHFYDGRIEIGARLMAEQFPNAIRDALEILPRDHEMRYLPDCRRAHFTCGRISLRALSGQ